ncbi:magnesium transporter CorA [Mesorhizobium sp. CGMCC 1.15528]|uniref:Magnesium transporter CorA n=1 Tax=Mesorhizobium zhangyense TaxID=1776730 RepID=A0A7C9VAU2_9HYPH|nr:CorA family divalent cation transporter [Mesorhizobium zhangyense]NGN40710.1 magnesium transporter CorA [Mesorhizobium zhangyense]
MADRAQSSETAKTPELDDEGLVLAFDFAADGYQTEDAGNASWNWKNYSLTDARGRRKIEALENLPAIVRATLLAGDDTLHIDYDEGWLHGAITDTRHKHYTDAREIGQLRFAFNETLLISARRHPLQSVDDVRRVVEQRKKPFRSPSELMEAIIVNSVNRLSGELIKIGDELDSIEDSIVGDAWHGERERLTAVRRQLVFIHRHVATVSGLLRHVEHMHDDELPPALSNTVSRLAQRSIALLHDSEQVQSRARLLQDELIAKLGAESNRLLYVLSVMTAVLLPMTIISGLFGMNVGGLPFMENPEGFWLVAIGSGLIAAIVYFAVRRIGGRN